MKTLIVEDDFMSRKVMMACLTGFGICDLAVNGIEAITAFEQAIYEQAPYDLVTLDIVMPGMDGRAVLNHIRMTEERYHIPSDRSAKVIMTTAHNLDESEMKTYTALCDAYFVKPIDIRSFQNSINDMGFFRTA